MMKVAAILLLIAAYFFFSWQYSLFKKENLPESRCADNEACTCPVGMYRIKIAGEDPLVPSTPILTCRTYLSDIFVQFGLKN